MAVQGIRLIDVSSHFLSFFANFRNFPIESLIKKTMIWGNFDQFSNLLNFQLICMKCTYGVKYKPNGYQSLRNNHTN